MGPRIGKTIVAWQIRVLDSGFGFPARNFEEQVEWSDVDPTVGVGTGPE